MTRSDKRRRAAHETGAAAPLLLDPRLGDAEDDYSSTKQRSLLAIAGSLFAEISLPKLLLAWVVSIVMPAVLLGLAPLVATAWFASLSGRISNLTGLYAVLILLAVAILGLAGWRPLFRIAEANFWSLNALLVQPGYAFCREALNHLAEKTSRLPPTPHRRDRLRKLSSAGAGIVLSLAAVVVAALAWPATRWVGSFADIAQLHRLIMPTIANAVVLVSAYLAAASLLWGFADAGMDQPHDLAEFDQAPATGRQWRIVHLSDVHAVGERFGFRIECGRSGPRGNQRLAHVMDRIAAIDAEQRLDLILITGDMTDAGRATEWAEFLEAIARHPSLAGRIVILPGNHDLNIVDRANPARLDLPFSPGRRLRQMRALSAILAVQGARVHPVDGHSGALRGSLDTVLAAERERIAAFADGGGLRAAVGLGQLWNELFPMILPPEREDGLGVAILDSNAEAHFSFTNALGLMSAGQARRLEAAIRRFPKARWIIALHHHVIEYPMPVHAFSERVGTALINGSWFVRKLKPLAAAAVVMHGHRHIDWIGTCGGVRIVSAPSPVMGALDGEPTHFHIHTLAEGEDGRLLLLPPSPVEIAGLTEQPDPS